MKSPILAAIAFLPCLAFAGNISTVIPPEVVQELSVMTSRLNLSEGQQARIRPILVAEWNKKESIANSTLSDKQKHDQEGVNHRAALQKIKVLFTADQLAQIEQGQNHPAPSPTWAGS